MITKISTFSGADFRYTNESNCTATGEYRVENGKLVSVNANGQYDEDGRSYSFWAKLDASGNINVSGVPASVLTPVAEQVEELVAEIEALIEPVKEEE